MGACLWIYITKLHESFEEEKVGRVEGEMVIS